MREKSVARLEYIGVKSDERELTFGPIEKGLLSPVDPPVIVLGSG